MESITKERLSMKRRLVALRERLVDRMFSDLGKFLSRVDKKHSSKSWSRPY
jgi:hypothetical protein